MGTQLTLLGELYSSKNSKRVFRRCGRTFVLPSKVYQRSKLGFFQQLNDAKNKGIWLRIQDQSKLFNGGNIYPMRLKIKIYRRTKRQFDYINIIQGLQDMLVQAEYLPDDSAIYLMPFFESYEIDPINPRVTLSFME